MTDHAYIVSGEDEALKKLRVLLLSPVPGFDSPGGDATYTQGLLENPPEGVEYEPYDCALQRGALREHGRRTGLKEAFRRRSGIASEALLVASNNIITRFRQGDLFRQGNLLFWEPFRFFSLHTRDYDLIHVHIFSTRFKNNHCPIVASNGGELAQLYRHARGFSEPMIRRRQRADRMLGKLMRVDVNSEYLPQVSRLMTYSHEAKSSFVQRGVLPKDRIDVVPPFLPSVPAIERSLSPKVVGFIARNFEDKGGPTLLKAWPTVRAQHPKAELLIVGCDPQMSPEEAQEKGIIWRSYMERSELLTNTLPSIDVFAYPTNHDYLPCYALLEAMSRGIPVAGSDHAAMPEVLDYGSAGLLSPQRDASALASNIVRLLDPVENARFGRAAREQFECRFSSDVVGPMIRSSYDAALND